MEFIQYVQQASVTMTEACEKFHISRKTGYKWLKRYESAGAQGLRDMCRVPKNQPTKQSPEVIRRIISIRQAHKSWGADKI
ncbi:MAG: helix-turn-helix domain-containing protein, partial [Akkermansia sp.]